MLLLEHSAIILTCIKRLLVLKSNFGLLFEWPLKTGFTLQSCNRNQFSCINTYVTFVHLIMASNSYAHYVHRCYDNVHSCLKPLSNERKSMFKS